MDKVYTYRSGAQLVGKSKAYVSAEGVPLALQFSAPPEFNGERGKWTPEHMFVAAAASCFAASFRAIAEHAKFDYVSVQVDAEGTLTKSEDGFKFTRVVLRPRVVVLQEDDREQANKLLLKSERACIIARSIHTDVVLESYIAVQSAAEIALPVPAY